MSRDGSHWGAGDLPRVSVVVPVRDGAETISSLLHSLLSLDYPEDRHELIIVDNDSKDGTSQIVSQLRGLTLLHETSRHSSYAARNRGIEAASGELIAFTDADCVVDRRWLLELSAGFTSPRIGAVAGRIDPADPDSAFDRLAIQEGLLDQESFLRGRPLPAAATANLAFRRTTLERLGGFDDDLFTAGDFVVCWRLQLELGQRIAYRPTARVAHRFRRSLPGVFQQARRNGYASAWMARRFADYRPPRAENARRLLRMFASIGGLATYPIHRRRDSLLAPAFLAARNFGLLVGKVEGSLPRSAKGSANLAGRHRQRSEEPRRH